VRGNWGSGALGLLALLFWSESWSEGLQLGVDSLKISVEAFKADF
jgi:hypothetical protein